MRRAAKHRAASSRSLWARMRPSEDTTPENGTAAPANGTAAPATAAHPAPSTALVPVSRVPDLRRPAGHSLVASAAHGTTSPHQAAIDRAYADRDALDRAFGAPREELPDPTPAHGTTLEPAPRPAPALLAKSATRVRPRPRWIIAIAAVLATALCGYFLLTGGSAESTDTADRFGASPSQQAPGAPAVHSDTAPTGFFRVDRGADGRWGFRTPDGRPFYSTGIDEVRADEDTDRITGTCTYCQAVAASYATRADWLQTTAQRLRTWNINTLGAGSDPALRGLGFPYAAQLDIDASWHPNDQPADTQPPPVHDWFDPAFAAHAAAVVQEKAAPLAADPNLLGWFLDNSPHWGPELSNSTTLLDAYRTLPEGSPGRAMADRYESDPKAFLKVAAARYFEVTTRALRDVDPHHLILGVRASALATPSDVVEIAGSWVDVFSVKAEQVDPSTREFLKAATSGSTVDYTPDLRTFHELSGRPLLVTDFTFRGADSGMPNTVPAYLPVSPTQQERADGYQQFVQPLLDAPWVIGHHWYRYADEPSGGRTTPADGADGNVGAVGLDDRPWDALVQRMAETNARAPYRD